MLKRIDKFEADLILDFMVSRITKEDLVQRYPELITQDYVIECLQSALEQTDSIGVDSAMGLVDGFEFYDARMLPVLEQLLVAGWHTRNEDIAHELQRLASPTSVEPLYYAITTKFGYRDDDELFSFPVQCVWALGAINTAESREKMKQLSSHEVKPIRKEAKHQMKMWKIT